MSIVLVERFKAFLGRAEGETLAELLLEPLGRGERVQIDFAHVDTALPSFFNALFGTLVESFSLEELKGLVVPVSMNDLFRASWQSAIENAATTDEEADSIWQAASKSLLG